MRNNWDKWWEEVLTDLDVRHNMLSSRLPTSLEDEAWRAWQAGRDSQEFADEWVRGRRPEF